VYPVLLQGQGVTIERPRRALGTLVAAAPAALSAVLGLALIAKATTWPLSLTMFAGVIGAVALLVLAALFLFWALSTWTMHYTLDRKALTIVWGTVRQVVPMSAIQELSIGRARDRPSVSGLTWPGLQVGRGSIDEREALFYSTHRTSDEIVYVRTGTTTYALSPLDPPRFVSEVERFKKASPAEEGEAATVQRDIIGAHPIWADRIAQWLALAAVAVNVALWGYIFAVYRDLSPQITIEFPPLGDITETHSRDQLLWIPGAALAVLGVNLALTLGFQWRERAAAYLMLSGTAFLQLIFWVSAGIAVANA
jgi:hypothetical protein